MAQKFNLKYLINEELQNIMGIYNTNQLLFEISGYKNIDILVDSLINEQININKFDYILNSYINESIYDNKSIITIYNKFIKPLLEKILDIIEKHTEKGFQILSKILDIVQKFKKKYPVFSKVIIVILFLFIIFGFQNEAHAAVLSPHGNELSNDNINMMIGVAEKAAHTLDNSNISTMIDIGKFQSELVKARDNAEYIVDLSKNNQLSDIYNSLIDWMRELRSINKNDVFEQILNDAIRKGNLLKQSNISVSGL